jgi:hypothetical protein
MNAMIALFFVHAAVHTADSTCGEADVAEVVGLGFEHKAAGC